MEAKKPANKREFTRTSVRIAAQMESEDVSIHCDQTRDLSMKGLFLLTKDRLPVGTTCRTVLYLVECGSPLSIEVTAKVVRTEEDGMAIEFLEILEPECFEYLRNLVLYNSPNPERVEKELDSHIGLRPRKRVRSKKST